MVNISCAGLSFGILSKRKCVEGISYAKEGILTGLTGFTGLENQDFGSLGVLGGLE